MATYYVDYATGANNTYTALTSCVASNPSGTITRITKTAHGLANGNIVVLTGFSAWLNTQWTVTNSNPNYFDLQGAVWQTTAITSGTVQRFWGRQWSEPWDLVMRQTTTAAGDLFKIAKTSDPTSIGNATWTSKSITVTLASSQTTLIDDVDSGWTANASGDVTITYDTTNKKSGTGRGIFTFDATPQTNIKQAYKTLGAALNLSSYDSITFWLTNSAAITDNNRLKIALCSDTTGDTIVDEFYIPQVAHANGIVSLNLTRNGGGSLGTNINSVALYSMGAAVTASSNYTLDNINACNANGIHLNTMISKSSTAWNYDENWYPIKNINGTTITLDSYYGDYSTAFGAALRGYYTTGTSPETVTTYILNPYQAPMIRTNAQGSQATGSMFDYFNGNTSGSSGNTISISYGWNKNTDTRDGMTWVNMRSSGSLFYFNLKDYIDFSYAGCFRGYMALETDTPSASGLYPNRTITFCAATGCFLGVCNFFVSANTNTCFTNYTVSCSNYYGNAYNSDLGVWTNYKIISCSNLCSTSNFMTGSQTDWKIYNVGAGAGATNSNRTFRFYSNNSTYSWITITNFDIRDCACTIFAGTLSGESYSTIYYPPNKFDNLNVINCNSYAFIDNNNTSGSSQVKTDHTLSPIIFTNTTITNSVSQPLGSIASNVNFYNSNNAATTKSINNSIRQTVSYDKFNNSESDYRLYGFSANVLSNSVTTYSGSGISWQVNITGNWTTETNSFRYKVATIAYNAGSLVTYKAWVQKTHATNIAAKLYILGGIVPGVTTDVSVTKANDTNWQQLTLTFTPTQKGVVDVYLATWAPSSPYTNSVYIDAATIAQA